MTCGRHDATVRDTIADLASGMGALRRNDPRPLPLSLRRRRGGGRPSRPPCPPRRVHRPPGRQLPPEGPYEGGHIDHGECLSRSFRLGRLNRRCQRTV
jgi:hypothetical protein